MFDLSNLSNSSQTTSLALIAFASLMSLGLSLFLVFTYEKTTRDVARADHFIQSLLLFAIVTTTIMQSIGDSLARSFGIFGALAIVRFRSRIGNPRDVSFVFATMAVGISCGVHSFVNGTIGTLLFCIVVFLLRMTPFSQKQSLIGTLRFDIPEGSNDLAAVQALVKQYSRTFSMKGYRIFFDSEKRQGVEYEYLLRLKDEMQGVALAEALKKIPDIKAIRLSFTDSYESTPN